MLSKETACKKLNSKIVIESRNARISKYDRQEGFNTQNLTTVRDF